MEMRLKNALAIILAVFLTVSALPIAVVADDIKTDGIYKYWVSDGEAYIAAITDNAISGQVIIPEELGGFPVTYIDWLVFSGCKNITSVVIPDGVTSIGESAFCDCILLESVTIPDSVISIGYNAFCGCTTLYNIDMSDGAIYIGKGAFNDTAYYNNETNWDSGVLYIGNCLIKAKSDISGSYIINPGTKTIACGAFSGCKELVLIEISDGITELPEEAFFDCNNLCCVIMPKSVKEIGYRAFLNCAINDVYYDGTEYEKQSIIIDVCDNDSFINADWHYNYPVYFGKPGDINGDKDIDNKDLVRLFQYLSGWEVTVNTDALDVNGDGFIDNKDLTRLFQYLSNWDINIYPKSIPLNLSTENWINPTTGFMWPVAGYYGISRPFGSGENGFHSGMDISGGGISGRPILAIADGVVQAANNSWTETSGVNGNASFGNYCVINHGYITKDGVSTSYSSLYAHALGIVVSVGQTVKQGQTIGYVGSTGDSAGAHLHIGILKNGTWVNPYPLLRG